MEMPWVSIISFSMLLIIIFITKMYMHIAINKNEGSEPRITYKIELHCTHASILGMYYFMYLWIP